MTFTLRKQIIKQNVDGGSLLETHRHYASYVAPQKLQIVEA